MCYIWIWHSADDIDICALIYVCTQTSAIAKECRNVVYLSRWHSADDMDICTLIHVYTHF